MSDGDRGVETAAPRGPLRSTARALLFNPYHAPPPLPPPSHPPGEDRAADDRSSILRAADVSPEPMHAAILPLPLPLSLPCQAVAEWRKQANELWSSLFSRQTPSSQQRQQGHEQSAVDRAGQATQQAAVDLHVASSRTCLGASEGVPECCRKGFSSALLTLLLPSAFHPHPSEHDADTDIDSGSTQPTDAAAAAINESQAAGHGAVGSGRLASLIAAPDEHAEVLFDCPSPAAECAVASSVAESAFPSSQASQSPLAARMAHDMNQSDVSESDSSHEAPQCSNTMDSACPSGSAFVHLYEVR